MGSYFGLVDMLLSATAWWRFKRRAFLDTLRLCEHCWRRSCGSPPLVPAARLGASCRFLSHCFVSNVHAEAQVVVIAVPAGRPEALPITRSDKLMRGLWNIWYLPCFLLPEVCLLPVEILPTRLLERACGTRILLRCGRDL